MPFGNIGLPGLLLIAVVVLVLFGRGKISSLMGEVGKASPHQSRHRGWPQGDRGRQRGSGPRRDTCRGARLTRPRLKETIPWDLETSACRGLLLIAVVVLVLFGRGKISSMMGEVGKGITAFKKGMDDGRQARSRTRAPRRAT
jgi:TatA/E family protein of Tat protein translocase